MNLVHAYSFKSKRDMLATVQNVEPASVQTKSFVLEHNNKWPSTRNIWRLDFARQGNS